VDLLPLRGQTLPASAIQTLAVVASFTQMGRSLSSPARTGTLPPEYGHLVNLSHLSANRNGLSGAHKLRGWLYAQCLCWLTCWLANHAQDARNACASLSLQVPFRL